MQKLNLLLKSSRKQMADTVKVKKPRVKKVIEVQNVEPTFPCEFCKKEFSKEKTLLSHMCERMRRFGFMAYVRFYELSFKTKKKKDYSDFAESSYYIAFTKFGRYIENINAIEVPGFVDFLIRGQVKIDDWTNEIWYESWTRELAKKEQPMNAVERNILLMEQWASETGENWVDFFRKVSTVKATEWIRKGRISPWLLYSGVGQALFDRMSDEQLGLVKEWINPLFWNSKIRENILEVEQIRTILEEAGV